MTRRLYVRRHDDELWIGVLDEADEVHMGGRHVRQLSSLHMLASELPELFELLEPHRRPTEATGEATRAKPVRLGPRQRSVLASLRRSGWYDLMAGWKYGTHGETIKVLASLERLGLARVVVDPERHDHLLGGPWRTWHPV